MIRSGTRFCIAEAENRLSVLHEIQFVSGDEFEVLGVGLEKLHFLFVLRAFLFKIGQMLLLGSQILLHGGKACPFWVKPESNG